MVEHYYANYTGRKLLIVIKFVYAPYKVSTFIKIITTITQWLFRVFCQNTLQPLFI